MPIDDIARELYGLAPEEFTAARNARAKEARSAGDAELAAQVQSLRKPTTGAWLLNQLVRRHPDEVQQVIDVGAQLRAAQGTLSADELRALDRQRRQLTRAVAEQARALGREGGRRVTDQATAEVEETLRSAMVDAPAGAALTTGLLTDTFSSTGIEPVDLSRVAALGVPGGERAASASSGGATSAPDPKADPARRRRIKEAKAAVAQAESALRAAHERVEQARDQQSHARALREELESQREEVRRRLSELDEQVARAAESQEAAEQAHDQATRDESSAVEAAGRLGEQLESLLADG